MPTFDIVSKIDGQTLDNAINTAKKEILNRYDFNGSQSSIELDKKTNVVQLKEANAAGAIVLDQTVSVVATKEPTQILPVGIESLNGGTNGSELWAYVPRMLMPKLYLLAETSYATKHQFFVDGSGFSTLLV